MTAKKIPIAWHVICPWCGGPMANTNGSEMFTAEDLDRIATCDDCGKTTSVK